MRILVVSDSHGDRWRLSRIFDEQPKADYIFHLGDGAAEMEALRETLQVKVVYSVRGNGDFDCSLPLNEADEIDGVRFYACHGHCEKVKYTKAYLLERAREYKASVVLYGHTHVAATEYVDGVWLFNPGSAHNGEYGVIDISKAGILPQNLKLL